LDVKNFEKISTIDHEKTKQLKGNKNKKVSEGIIRGEPLPKNGILLDLYKLYFFFSELLSR
jgi:hypothetical protein